MPVLGEIFPPDKSPNSAIDVCRKWVSLGIPTQSISSLVSYLLGSGGGNVCKPIRRRRIEYPPFDSAVPDRPYTDWDDPLGDYNPYALYDHPYALRPESLKLYLGYIVQKFEAEG